MGKPKIVSSETMGLKKKRAAFTVDETHELLRIWASEEIQQLFSTAMRHNLIWNSIAAKHRSKGFSKTGAEVKSKIGNLKTEYRAVEPKSGGEPPDWPFFEIMHKVLGQRDCANDDLLDDSLTKGSEDQVDAEDVESYSSQQTPIEYNNGHSDHEVESLDSESQTNRLDENMRTSLNPKYTCQKKIKKIARPPRRKGSDESNLISLLIESEKRHNETLATMEEHERKTQEREATMAQSMNRFLTAFAVLAENQAKQGESLLSPLITPVAAVPQSFQTPSSGASSTIRQAHTYAKANANKSCSSDYVNHSRYTSVLPPAPKYRNNATVTVNNAPTTANESLSDYNDVTYSVNCSQQLNNISPLCEQESYKEDSCRNVLESAGVPNARPRVLSQQRTKPNSNQFKGILEPTKRAIQQINIQPTKLLRIENKKIDKTVPTLEVDNDDDELPAVQWAHPVHSINDENNVQQVHIKNLSSTKERIAGEQSKVNPQSSYHTVPEIKSQHVKIVHIKRPVQAVKLNNCQNVYPNTGDKKPSILPNKGLIYITLPKNK